MPGLKKQKASPRAISGLLSYFYHWYKITKRVKFYVQVPLQILLLFLYWHTKMSLHPKKEKKSNKFAVVACMGHKHNHNKCSLPIWWITVLALHRKARPFLEGFLCVLHCACKCGSSTNVPCLIPYPFWFQVNEYRAGRAPCHQTTLHPRFSSQGMAQVQDGHTDTYGRCVDSLMMFPLSMIVIVSSLL